MCIRDSIPYSAAAGQRGSIPIAPSSTTRRMPLRRSSARNSAGEAQELTGKGGSISEQKPASPATATSASASIVRRLP